MAELGAVAFNMFRPLTQEGCFESQFIVGQTRQARSLLTISISDKNKHNVQLDTNHIVEQSYNLTSISASLASRSL
jgi:hypothetical protein